MRSKQGPQAITLEEDSATQPNLSLSDCEAKINEFAGADPFFSCPIPRLEILNPRGSQTLQTPYRVIIYVGADRLRPSALEYRGSTEVRSVMNVLPTG